MVLIAIIVVVLAVAGFLLCAVLQDRE